MTCGYCTKPKGEGWHDCQGARSARARIDTAIASLRRIASGNSQLVQAWDPHRKRRLESMATQIRLRGGEVRPKHQL